eukprot:TRINITY_DN10523_c0_g1_i2.p2 TRINITY_DN10523_c0_g1~~TRINITY_DN10523_c0_g1_i2.p2  ORF type:complete len:102 (+),score=49.13 TRINITY_DN10523_c0_g1_i2:11-316(+)
MIRQPPRSKQSRSSAASDVYKRQSGINAEYMGQQRIVRNQLNLIKVLLKVFDRLKSGIKDIKLAFNKVVYLENGEEYQRNRHILSKYMSCLLYTSPSPRDS